MSKRFGRNQKRKMKAKIEYLKDKADRSHTVALRQSQKAYDTETELVKTEGKLRKLIAKIRAHVPNSVVLEPPRTKLPGKILPEVFYIEIHNLPEIILDLDYSALPSNLHSFDKKELRAVYIDIQKILDHKSGFHILLQTKDGKVGYYLDDHRYLELEEPKHIVEEMIEHLMREREIVR